MRPPLFSAVPARMFPPNHFYEGTAISIQKTNGVNRGVWSYTRIAT